MGNVSPRSLRDRMTPPAAQRSTGDRVRLSEVDRVLHLATDLFGVATAALVLASPAGLRIEAVSGGEACRADDILGAAGRLFEILASPEAPAAAGVLEEVAPHRGLLASTPILSADGRCLGAICLADAGRKTLLTQLQRRLFGEFGGLLAPSLRDGDRGSKAFAAGAALLQEIVDRDEDAVALFDADGRCLLRNRRFCDLLGTPAAASPPHVPAARGCEDAWLALHLARDTAPVGIYRAAMADGSSLCVEERRGPAGYSLVVRREAQGLVGGHTDAHHLFERCPFAMFVVDRERLAVMAANAAALSLYGWDRDGFEGLDAGRIGFDPASRGPEDRVLDWTHRRRDGRPIAVSGRCIDLMHRGRPALLVTVIGADEAEDLAA